MRLVRFELEGIAPENAVKRLKREKIELFYLQKPRKNRVSFCVERKYRKKVFTIFSRSCYNILEAKPFGLYAFFRAALSRAGVFLGAALFLALCLFSDRFVLRIKVEGTGNYYGETVLSLLEENGIAVGRAYKADAAEEATARILALPDVEFCTLKKEGSVLRVEVRVSPSSSLAAAGSLCSPAAGKVYSLTVLRGNALVSEGEEVEAGRELVSAAAGEKIVLAGAQIFCSRSAEGSDGDAALSLLLLEAERLGAEVLSSRVKAEGNGFRAELEYCITVRKNI